VAQSAAAQDEHSIADLPLARVPEEIAPLVTSINALLARLREAFDSQRRFVQDAAHELRTPLTALYLQLENLRAHVPAGDASLRFSRLEGGIQRMRRLIEQLLQLSQQEAPSRPTPADLVDIDALLQDSVNELIVLADQRRIDIGYSGEASPSVRAHGAEVRSIFVNLIDNALRYTPVGGVVDVRLHELDHAAVVDVIDNGPGIPPQLLARAFDRFFRVPGSPVPGVGLGLAIAQGAAQRNGMHIELIARHDTAGLIARVHLRAAG
jgi:two-component system OmpR family sensor kinase/two-component system sensor histidine kinase QseC